MAYQGLPDETEYSPIHVDCMVHLVHLCRVHLLCNFNE